jgi:hypothetical protein
MGRSGACGSERWEASVRPDVLIVSLSIYLILKRENGLLQSEFLSHFFISFHARCITCDFPSCPRDNRIAYVTRTFDSCFFELQLASSDDIGTNSKMYWVLP